MKKWSKRIVILLGVVGTIGILGAIWQRENIKLIYESKQYAKQYATEESQQPDLQSKEEIEQALNQYQLESIRELTDEEKSQLIDGELSIDEAANRLLESEAELDTAKASSDEVNHKEENLTLIEQDTKAQAGMIAPTEQIEVKVKDETEIVKAYTAKMYALQSKYVGKLSQVESQGWGLLDSYSSGSQSIKELMPQGMNLVRQAMSLQAQCDGEVDSILQSLTQELEEVGSSSQVVETMRSVYEAEKRAKKAYYLSLIPQI